MFDFIEHIEWEEIKEVWEEQLWPAKKNGVRPINNWTWEWNKDELGEDKDMEASPLFYGLRSNKKLVGVNSCYMSNNDQMWNYWRSRGLWVSPEFRNQGYATSLLSYGAEYARMNRGGWIFSVPRQSAFSAYHSAGFTQKSDWFDDGQFGPNCIASKYL